MNSANPLVSMAIFALGVGLSKAVSLLMLPFVTAHLSAEQYGWLDVLVTSSNGLSLLCMLALPDLLLRLSAKSSMEQAWVIYQSLQRLAIKLSLIWLLLGQGVLLLWSPEALADLQLLFASLALSPLLALPLCWLRLNNASKHFVCVVVYQAVAQACGTLWVLKAGLGVTGMMLVGLLVSMSSLALCRLAMGKGLSATRSLRLARNDHLYLLCMTATGLSSFALGGAERLFIAQYDLAELAGYAVAAQFSLGMALLFEPFVLWWFARRQKVAEANPARAGRINLVGCFYLLSLCLLMSLLVPWFVRQFLPPAYHHALTFLPWLLLVGALRLGANLLGLGGVMRSQGRWQFAASLVLACVGVLAFSLLIPIWGAQGAIAALVLVHSLRLVSFVLISQHLFPIVYPRSLSLLLLGMLGLLVLVAIEPVMLIVAGAGFFVLGLGFAITYRKQPTLVSQGV